jgi:hypothetical protein
MRPARATAGQLRASEAAAWGPRPEARLAAAAGAPAKMDAACHRRADRFPVGRVGIGLILNDLPLMTGKNGLWIALPAKKQFDRDGNPRVDTNGKPAH